MDYRLDSQGYAEKHSLEKNETKDITRKKTSLEEEGVSKSGVVEERAVGQTI